MARRIGLAQALINDPKLLILDEPTSGLDPIGTRQIKDLIVELARRGKTVLLSSHLLADAEEVCDRVAILYGGNVQKEGKIEDLLEQKDKTQITSTVLSDRTLEQIRRIVEKDGGEIEVKPPMQKLESYFIDIVNQAQKARKYTSGAVNNLDASDAQRAAAMSDVLDKLVSAKVDSQKLEKVEAPAVVETEKTGTDLNVINQLAQGPEPQMPEKVEPVKKPENINVQEEIKKNILDELTKSEENKNE
jgi:ABC-2 type transport system ATP-binding protein